MLSLAIDSAAYVTGVAVNPHHNTGLTGLVPAYPTSLNPYSSAVGSYSSVPGLYSSVLGSYSVWDAASWCTLRLLRKE